MAAANMDKEALMNQAQHIWTMLDEMAKNNPAGYKKFIDQQIKQGKEELAPPKPHMCISTYLKAPETHKLYINFFSWHRIPGPKTPEDAIPVMGSNIDQDTDTHGHYKVTSVAFSPKVLEEFGRDAKNPADFDTLINLAMDYIDQLNHVKCSRNYSVLPKDELYKGNLQKLQKSFTVKSEKNDQEFSDNFDELAKTFGPLAGTSKGGLFEQLANIAVDDNPPAPNTNTQQPEILISDKKVRKPGLIEELSSSPSTMKSSTKPELSSLPETPKYEVEKSWNDQKEGQCTIRIFLPKVCGVGECELDISEDELSLEVPEKYNLKIQLVDKVNDDMASAKFIKKSNCLVVNIPLIKI